MRLPFLLVDPMSLIFIFNQKITPGIIYITSDRLRSKRLVGIIQRSRKSQDCNIFIIPPVFTTRLRNRQIHCYLFTSVYIRPAPYQMTHRIFRFDPRTACHRPARTVLHRKTQTQPATFFCSMFYRFFPRRAQTGNLRFYSRPGTAKLSVKQLDTG